VQGDTEKERGQIDTLKDQIRTVNGRVKELRDEKRRIIAKFNAEYEIKQSYEQIRRNVEKARYWKESISRIEERKQEQADEEKKKKENQMSEHEVNIAYGRQLTSQLESLKKAGGKKVILDLNVVLLFGKCGIKELPKRVKDIDATLELVNAFTKEQEAQEETRKNNENWKNLY